MEIELTLRRKTILGKPPMYSFINTMNSFNSNRKNNRLSADHNIIDRVNAFEN